MYIIVNLKAFFGRLLRNILTIQPKIIWQHFQSHFEKNIEIQKLIYFRKYLFFTIKSLSRNDCILEKEMIAGKNSMKQKKEKRNQRPLNFSNNCAVVSCPSPSGIPYKSFPKDPKLQEKWISACKTEPNSINVKTAKVCLRHFTQDCFERDLKNELLGLPVKKILKHDAFPSLNLEKESNDPVPLANPQPRNLAEVNQFLLRLNPVTEESLENINGRSEVQRKEIVDEILGTKEAQHYMFAGKDSVSVQVESKLQVNFIGAKPKISKVSTESQCEIVKENDFLDLSVKFKLLKRRLNAEKRLQRKLHERVLRSERKFFKEEIVRKFLRRRFNTSQTKFIMGEDCGSKKEIIFHQISDE